MKNSFLAAALTLSLSSVSLPALAEPWIHEPQYDQDNAYYTITESYEIGFGSKIVREDLTKEGWAELNYCPEIGEYCTAKILGNGQFFPTREKPSTVYGDLVMGVCTNQKQDYCIESIRIYQADEKPVKASLIREIDTMKTKAFPRYKLPAGGSASLWKSNSTSEAAKDIEVSAYVRAIFRNYQGGLKVDSFTAIINPYVIEEGNYQKAGLQAVEKTDRNRSGFTEVQVPKHCAWVEEGVCGRVIDFPADTRYGITFRINKEIVQLFDGRLQDPNISVSKMSGNRRKVSIDGEPVTVSALSFGIPLNDPRVDKLDIFKSSEKRAGNRYSSAYYFEDGAPWVKEAKKVLNDTAVGTRQWWRLSAQGQLTGCWNKQGEIVGLVTSNATIYSGGAPKMKNGFLNYSVGGLHYLPDGVTKSVGTYDLVLRSDVARCLYKISRAPVSATVSVVGEDQDVATTIFGEKNGWIKLSAYGFGFSTKTIKVKLRNR